jgi:hypothetical protein
MITNVGLSLAGVSPQEPSLIRDSKPKPLVDQVAENVRRQQLIQALPEKTEKLLPETVSTREIKRYGDSPSFIERSADTGVNTVGLRNPIVSTEPEPTPELVEKRGGRHVDELELSPAERNRQAAIMTRSPRDPSAAAPGDYVQQFHTSPSDVLMRDSHPATYEAFRRAVEEPQRGTILNETA